MAKGKKKGKAGKKRHKRVAHRAMIGTFAGGLLGKVVEKVLADTILNYVHPKHHGKRAKNGKHHADANEQDVAAKLLEGLAGGGPRSIPQLLAETHLGLSPVLHALQSLRDLRLINLVGDAGDELMVEVTRSGAQAVTAFRQNHIREEAARLLQ
jgi:hypothetical protein